MKRIDRYIFKEMVPPFFMAVLIVIVMFQANFYMALGKNDLTRNVPIGAVLKILFLETPGFLIQTLPIAVSLAASLALSRIARESELTAFRSAGVRIMRVLLPVAIFGAMIGGIDYYVTDSLAPACAKASMELKTNVNILASVGQFITNVQIKLGGYWVNIGSITKENSKDDKLLLKNITLIERPEPDQVNIIMAPDGYYRQGLWLFQNATTFKSRFGTKSMETLNSRYLKINQKITVRDLMMAPEPETLGIQATKLKIEEIKKLGQDPRLLQISYHNKISTPFMCLIFALVSPIFSIKFAKQGGFIGVVISMVVIMLYFNAWVISTQIIGKDPHVNPAVAAWLPNIIFMIAGLLGLRSLE
ncbi:MAG: LptF/LptG family permease [Armatimonadota bacterium]